MSPPAFPPPHPPAFCTFFLKNVSLLSFTLIFYYSALSPPVVAFSIQDVNIEESQPPILPLPAPPKVTAKLPKGLLSTCRLRPNLPITSQLMIDPAESVLLPLLIENSGRGECRPREDYGGHHLPLPKPSSPSVDTHKELRPREDHAVPWSE